MADDLDFDELAERTLRPERARLADAVAVTYDWEPAMVRSWLDACDAPDDITAAIEASVPAPLDEIGTASEASERLVLPDSWAFEPIAFDLWAALRSWMWRAVPIDAAHALTFVLEGERQWRLACERGYSVGEPRIGGGETAPVGARFDALPDPYAPLLAIWRLGYALEAVSDEAVVLVAPELGS